MRTLLDIKTSASPQAWWRLQLAAYSLLDTPVKFEEEGHLYDGGRFPSVTGILKAEGFIDGRFYDDFSRDRGTYVHLATELDDRGELDEDSLDPAIVPYLEAWRKFRAESGFIVEETERSLSNLILGYAGTIDRIGRFPSGNVSRCAVQLSSAGTYRLHTYKDRQDIEIWRCIMAVHNWKQHNMGGK